MRVGDEQEVNWAICWKILRTNQRFNIQSCLSTDLESLLANLTSQQREVLILRFGLADGQPLTLGKLAFA